MSTLIVQMPACLSFLISATFCQITSTTPSNLWPNYSTVTVLSSAHCAIILGHRLLTGLWWGSLSDALCWLKDVCQQGNLLMMRKSIRIDSAGQIDSNRFMLPNHNEKFWFSTQLQNNALATCITVLQDRFMAHIRVNVATHFCKAGCSCVTMQAGWSWLQWTGPAASRPESRTPGVDSEGGSDRAMNRLWHLIESNRFLFCRIAHH